MRNFKIAITVDDLPFHGLTSKNMGRQEIIKRILGAFKKFNIDVIKLTYGHSKDHRPDLKQAVMSLVVSGTAAIPIWMEPHDGNSSDKKEFHETIKKVCAFQKQLNGCPEFKWVADSALYNRP